MKKISVLLLSAILIISAAALTGCGDSTFTVGWPNADIHGQGKKITADYYGTPSTGYEWTVEIGDENVIKQTSHTSEDAASDGSGNMVGTRQVEHYAFEVVGDGETLVTAKYARSWEETPDDLEYVFKVIVTNGKISKMYIQDDLTDSLFSALGDTLSLPTDADALEDALSLPTNAGA